VYLWEGGIFGSKVGIAKNGGLGKGVQKGKSSKRLAGIGMFRIGREVYGGLRSKDKGKAHCVACGQKAVKEKGGVSPTS